MEIERRYLELFNDSYERLRDDLDKLFDNFYDRFVKSSNTITKVFGGTNKENQVTMLERSFLYIISYASCRDVSPDLARLAKYHLKFNDITSLMYNNWLQSLLDAVADLDPKYTPEVGNAWRIMLEPGIDFMRNYK